jgi:hypothetical protein
MVSSVKNSFPVRYLYLHYMINSCQAITILRKLCAWQCSKEGDKTQQTILFSPFQEFFSRYAQQQSWPSIKNVFAPDKKSLKSLKKKFENRVPNRRNQ